MKTYGKWSEKSNKGRKYHEKSFHGFTPKFCVKKLKQEKELVTLEQEELAHIEQDMKNLCHYCYEGDYYGTCGDEE